MRKGRMSKDFRLFSFIRLLFCTFADLFKEYYK